MVWGAIIGAGVSIGSSIIGGGRRADAAADQANAQRKAAYAQYQYDLDGWEAKKQQLQQNRQHTIDEILTKSRNEGKERAYKDVANERNYNMELQIRGKEQTDAEIRYKRSHDIYTDTTDINSITAKAAMDSEIWALQESAAEQRFDAQELYIERLQAEGKMRATMASGRSAIKGYQTTFADYGRQMAMLNATLDSSNRGTRSALKEIMRDRTSADLTAFAAKMLDPGVLPMPIKPDVLPVPEFQLPRAFNEYDFGPKPVLGVLADPGAAADMEWGSTISNVGSTLGSFASGFSWSNKEGSKGLHYNGQKT